MDNGDGKPISQVFADELRDLVVKYFDSGLSNAEAVGVLSMYLFDFMYKVRKDAEIINRN